MSPRSMRAEAAQRRKQGQGHGHELVPPPAGRGGTALAVKSSATLPSVTGRPGSSRAPSSSSSSSSAQSRGRQHSTAGEERPRPLQRALGGAGSSVEEGLAGEEAWRCRVCTFINTPSGAATTAAAAARQGRRGLVQVTCAACHSSREQQQKHQQQQEKEEREEDDDDVVCLGLCPLPDDSSSSSSSGFSAATSVAKRRRTRRRAESGGQRVQWTCRHCTFVNTSCDIAPDAFSSSSSSSSGSVAHIDASRGAGVMSCAMCGLV
jgi:hypothetical protein